MSTLLLCDDHRVVREALADLLSSLAGVTAVTQAGSGEEVPLSQDTVKVHAKKLFAKTGVHDRAAAVAWAFRSGVLA